MRDWQPIKTAPRDGRPIWGGQCWHEMNERGGYYTAGYVVAAFWDGEREVWASVADPDMCCMGLSHGVWQPWSPKKPRPPAISIVDDTLHEDRA